jgi:hypothetical protein
MERAATVDFSQHCELTLALAIADRYKNAKFWRSGIEVGGSDMPCCWCREYLDWLNDHFPYQISTRASRGEQPDGWMMPPSGPEGVARKMADSIERKLDAVIDRVQRREAFEYEMEALKGN